MPATQLPWSSVVGLVAVGYVCGSIPFGLLIGWMKAVDVRTKGSCNIGATNVGRVLGRPYGFLVFFLDGLKGFLPVTLARFLLIHADRATIADTPGYLPFLLLVLVAVACVLGHMFPVWLKFKGGKGVASSLGVGLGIYPYYTLAGLLAFALWGLVLALTRYVSLSSIIAVVGFPVFFAGLAWIKRDEWGGLGDLWPLHVFCAVIAILVVYRHRTNISRLLAGTEQKIGVSSGRQN